MIGIAEICELIRNLSQQTKVRFHIIGSGERTQELITRAEDAGADVIFHGAVYDPARKQQILDKCHFGLNIMKSSVCVGLTMKSVDYFRHGIPVINNIPADTRSLVMTQDVGVQLDRDCVGKILSMSLENHLQMRKNVNHVFDRFFTRTCAENTVCAILKQLLR